MPQYKLHYFDLPGRAEGIRLAFHYAGVPFEDARINRVDWLDRKDEYKYKQVPVLEVDGHSIAQTNAILRYVGRKFGLEGKDEFETAKLDELNELMNEVQFGIGNYPGVALGFVPGDVEELRNERLIPTVEKYAPLFEKAIVESGSGFFVASGPSYLDFHIAEVLNQLSQLDPDIWEKYTIFGEHYSRVHGLPQLKHYLETRPE